MPRQKRCPLVSSMVTSALVGLLAAWGLGSVAIAAEEIADDKIATAKGDLLITPIQHATLALRWSGKTIYVDPVGGAERFRGLPPPDLILLTDIHGDHMDAATLGAVTKGQKTMVVMPKAVDEALTRAEAQFPAAQRKVLSAGEKAKLDGMEIEAVLAYNKTPERKKFHEKDRGVGYILDLAGTRVYISGDTEDTPETRALRKIDVAFLCMNLPYTMTVEQAASAALDFQPKVVYPYHSRGQDTNRFKALVEEKSKSIEVRLRDWYAKK